jgi:phosphate/sulfate permease
MEEKNKSDHFTLEPSWKYFFWSYVLSVLAIPVVAGLIALYFVRRKHKSIKYEITNDQITAIDQKYEHHIDLVDIEEAEVLRSQWHETLGIGTLRLHTSAAKMELAGLTNPEKISDILEQAIESRQKLQEQRQETQKKESGFKAGSMDRIEYLTGLWQQGLFSDADYKAERKHFE